MIEIKRDWTGRIIGKFHDLGETIVVQDGNGRIRGKYYKRLDKTVDESGGPVGSGNLLMTLLD